MAFPRKSAQDNRKNTIGKELKLLNKQNKIRDQRLGQHNSKLTNAQKAELRFVAQRKKLSGSKKNKFLLNDENGDGKVDFFHSHIHIFR